MSDNPFKSEPAEPVPYAKPAASGQKVPPSAPGALTPILVFCLILGILGLIGTCLGGAGIAMMSAFERVFEGVPMPEDQKVFNKLNMNAQMGVILPSVILMLINLGVATMLIIGSIGCFKRRQSSRVFLRMALLVAIFYSLLKITATVFVSMTANSALHTSIENLKNDPMYEKLKDQYTTAQVFTIGGIVFGVVIGIAILGFYIWARSYLNKNQVIEHFAAVENYKRSSY